MTDAETFLVSRYAASELAGALLLGKFARRASTPFLRTKLIWHCYEESRHAWLWAELLDGKNVPILEVHDMGGSQYFSHAESIEDEIDFLSFVHVYESRVPFHFMMHADLPGSDDDVRKLLSRLAREEGDHLDWISKYLREFRKIDEKRVLDSLSRFAAIEEKTYLEDLRHLKRSGGELRMLGEMIEGRLPGYRPAWKGAIGPADYAS